MIRLNLPSENGSFGLCVSWLRRSPTSVVDPDPVTGIEVAVPITSPENRNQIFESGDFKFYVNNTTLKHIVRESFKI